MSQPNAEYVAVEVLAECEQTDDGWVHSCGTILSGARVAHSVHDGPFPLSGSGRVGYQTVPFCSSCHEQPSAVGTPVTRTTTDWPVVKVRRKAAHNDGPGAPS